MFVVHQSVEIEAAFDETSFGSGMTSHVPGFI
jgi:hypothetical protein